MEVFGPLGATGRTEGGRVAGSRWLGGGWGGRGGGWGVAGGCGGRVGRAVVAVVRGLAGAVSCVGWWGGLGRDGRVGGGNGDGGAGRGAEGGTEWQGGGDARKDEVRHTRETHALQHENSFNNLVGASEQRRRKFKAERFRRS